MFYGFIFIFLALINYILYLKTHFNFKMLAYRFLIKVLGICEIGIMLLK